MELSIIIVSYNVRHFLNLCLFSVRKAAEGIKSEIFVVDNNSSDESCNMVRSEYPEVKLIANNENKGFSVANNQAIKLASGKYILLLNPDTVIGENTFRKCIQFMDTHPDAGATGVRMINGNGRFLPESKRAIPDPETAFFRISGLSYLFPGSGKFNRYYLGNIDNTKTARVDIIAGAFMFLRREAVLKTGLLDENFFMYGEDIDYSYRLLKAGYSNYYFPEVKIIHFKGESTKKEEISFVINFYKAMLIFVQKHFNNGNLKKLIIPIRIAIFSRAALSVIYRFFKRISFLVEKSIVSSICPRKSGNPFSGKKKTVIVSDAEGYQRIKELLSLTGSKARISGRISIDHEDLHEEVLGNIKNISEVIKLRGIRQVIFTSGRLGISEIIDTIHFLSHKNLRVRIASGEEKYLLGSKSVIDPVIGS